MASTDLLSKFGPHTRALEVVQGLDLSGKLAIVTGGNSGLGFEVTKALVSVGCFVVLGCRDMNRAATAIEQVKQLYPNAQLDAFHIDNVKLITVKQFAEQFLAKYKHRTLDILLLNAGMYPAKFEVTQDGLETTMQVNVIAQHYLAKLLIPKMLETKNSRLIIMSSVSALLMADPRNFKDPVFTEEFIKQNVPNLDSVFYDAAVFNDQFYKTGTVRNEVAYMALEVYGYSKAMVAFWTQELHRRYSSQGLCAYSVSPGSIATRITQHIPEVHEYHKFSQNKDVEQGASTSTVCCALPNIEKYSGRFFDDCKPRDCMPSLFDADSEKNKEVCKKLWESTEKQLEEAIAKFPKA